MADLTCVGCVWRRGYECSNGRGTVGDESGWFDVECCDYITLAGAVRVAEGLEREAKRWREAIGGHMRQKGL